MSAVGSESSLCSVLFSRFIVSAVSINTVGSVGAVGSLGSVCSCSSDG